MKITNVSRSPLGLPGMVAMRPGASCSVQGKIWGEMKKNPAVAAWLAGGHIVEGESKDKGAERDKASAKAAVETEEAEQPPETEKSDGKSDEDALRAKFSSSKGRK